MRKIVEIRFQRKRDRALSNVILVSCASSEAWIWIISILLGNESHTLFLRKPDFMWLQVRVGFSAPLFTFLLQKNYRSALLSLPLESHSMFLRLRLRCRICLGACSQRGATSRVAGQSDHNIVLLLRSQ